MSERIPDHHGRSEAERSDAGGNENRNVFCKQKVIEYIEVIQKIVQEGIDNGDIVKCDAEVLASEIFSLTCSALIYKRKKGLKEINIYQIYEEYEKTIFDKLI